MLTHNPFIWTAAFVTLGSFLPFVAQSEDVRFGPSSKSTVTLDDQFPSIFMRPNVPLLFERRTSSTGMRIFFS